MKKKLLILLGMFVFFQFGFSTSCNFSGYEKRDNKIFYYEGIWFGKPKNDEWKEIKKTDFKTFVSLDQRGFGKDKNHVYFRGKFMTDIDAKTFEVTSMMYENELKNTTAEHCFSPYVVEFKDKNGTYLADDVWAGIYKLEN